jgi:D-ribose pyranase
MPKRRGASLPAAVQNIRLQAAPGILQFTFGFPIEHGLFSRYNSAMLKTGILNPHVLNLLARVRHTNTLVIADRGFPFWPQLETVDLSLVDNVPTVLEVLAAVRAQCVFGKAWMAKEFLRENDRRMRSQFVAVLKGASVEFEPHVDFKQRVPSAIGLIRTGDTTQYANVILESA